MKKGPVSNDRLFFMPVFSVLLSIIQVLSGLNDYANNFRIFEDHIRKNTIFVL